jgi:ABC-2 type transport system permease protein
MSNKTGLIISREYFSRVKKKSFLLTTILVPLVIIGFYAAIIMISTEKSTTVQKVAVVDEMGLLSDSSALYKDFVFIKNETEAGFVPKYKKLGYDAFLYIPKLDLNKIDSNIRLHSNAAASLPIVINTNDILTKAVEKQRLKASGISEASYNSIQARVKATSIDDSKAAGTQTNINAGVTVSFICGFLIYIMMILYGTQVMRGVSEEKTNRIAEVIVSSVKPFQLMTGKIIGIGAVGLTQFAIWILIALGVNMLLPQISSISGIAASMLAGISSLPLLKIGLYFMFYFFGGYLTYAALFAAIGSMATDDQQDTQQLVFPVLMPIILGFVIMTKAISDPHSSLAVFGSLFPLTSPIVMMGRITYDIPVWQTLLSGALLVGCFLFFTWLTGKIYRVGILMYGKKPSWKAMFKLAVKR